VVSVGVLVVLRLVKIWHTVAMNSPGALVLQISLRQLLQVVIYASVIYRSPQRCSIARVSFHNHRALGAIFIHRYRGDPLAFNDWGISMLLLVILLLLLLRIAIGMVVEIPKWVPCCRISVLGEGAWIVVTTPRARSWCVTQVWRRRSFFVKTL